MSIRFTWAIKGTAGWGYYLEAKSRGGHLWWNRKKEVQGRISHYFRFFRLEVVLTPAKKLTAP